MAPLHNPNPTFQFFLKMQTYSQNLTDESFLKVNKDLRAIETYTLLRPFKLPCWFLKYVEFSFKNRRIRLATTIRKRRLCPDIEGQTAAIPGPSIAFIHTRSMFTDNLVAIYKSCLVLVSVVFTLSYEVSRALTSDKLSHEEIIGSYSCHFYNYHFCAIYIQVVF